MHNVVSPLPETAPPCHEAGFGSVQTSGRRPIAARSSHLFGLIAVAGLALSLAACVATGPSASTQPPADAPPSEPRATKPDDRASQEPEAPTSLADAPGISDDARAARRELEALIRDATPPDAPTHEIPLPPGLTPDDVAPATLDADATRSLDDIMSSAALPSAGQAAPPAVTDDARTEALRLYAQGRSKLLSGDPVGAIVDLESAVKLDHASPEPFRALGDARLAAGRRMSASDAYRRAASLGLSDPRVFWQLGLEADESNRLDDAIAYFSAALRSRPEKTDPAMPFVVWMDFSDALIKRGHLQAGVDAIVKAVSLPPQFGTTTRLRNELGELLRRRGELSRRAGDILCRLGQFERAVRAYEASAAHGAADPVSLWKRKTYALLRSSRRADAALLAVAIASSARGEFEPSDTAMLRYVAEASGHATLMRRAIATGSTAPTALSNIARARAAVAEPSAALDLLRAHLAAQPSDGAAARDFVSIALHQNPPAPLLARTVADSPHAAAAIARSLQARAASLDPILESLSRETSPAASLLRARVLILIERPSDALDALAGVNAAGDIAHAVALARVEAAMARGAFAVVDAGLASLSNAPPAIRARAFDLCGRRADAAELIKIALAQHETPQTLIDAASVALSTGDAPGAEKHLRRAFNLDPGEPRAYEGLITLYAPGGPLANQENLTEVARALRTTSPGSSLLRFLAAQELTQGGALQEAARLLKEIADDHPENQAVGTLLGTIWERARNADAKTLADNEAWTRTLIARHPEEPWPAVVLARVLVQQGKTEEAAAFLADRWNARPLRDYSIARERILRDVLKKTDEADAVESDRMARGSGTLTGAIELAISSLRRNDWAAAGDALNTAWPAWLSLNASATSALSGAIIGALGEKPADQLRNPDIARVIEAAVRLCPALPPQLHERRVQILASADPVDLAAVRAAVDRASKDFPSGAHVFNARAAIGVAGTAPKESLPFLRAAADFPAVADDLLFELLRMTVVHGEAPDIDALVAQFNTSASVTKIVTTALKEPKIPAGDAKAQAEFAYLLGNLCSSQGREEISRYCYRVALRFDPDHAWSMNNLGYAILERGGGDFAESEKFLSRAAQLLPDEASVVDSLAWLRYHENIVSDEVSADGTVLRAGAVTLLRRAVTLDGGKENPTLHDHLGDALWRAGNKDDAREAWKKALEFSRTDLRELSQNASNAARERLQKEFDSILAKLQALDAGREPQVALPIKPANQ